MNEQTQQAYGLGVTFGTWPTISERFLNFDNFKKQQKNNVWNTKIDTQFKTMEWLYNSSITAEDPETQKKSKNALKISEALMAAREEATKHWQDWSNATDDQVYEKLKQMYPDIKNKMAMYIQDDSMDRTGFKISMWWEQPVKEDGNFAQNLVWWAYDSVTWLPRMLASGAASAIWWVAKQFWADEEKVNELVNSYKDYINNEMSGKWIWADTDSATYKITKTVWDLAQVAAWEWLARGALQWTKVWQILNTAKNSWVLWKIWVSAIEWAGDMALYEMVSQSKLPWGNDLALWAGLWVAAPILWSAVKATKWVIGKTANKLELNWLLNPSKLTDVKNRLISEIWKKAEALDVWKWLIERWMKWDKPTIINKLWEWKQNAREIKLDILSKSTTQHDVPAAKKALQEMYDSIVDVPWMEEMTQKVSELMWKETHTLAELDEMKTLFDDIFDIYKNSWEVKAQKTAKWLNNIRNKLKTFIEEQAEAEWLWNVKMLNNEIQVSHILRDWIMKKDSADAVREALSIFSKPAIWWLAWWTIWWPFDENTFLWKVGNVIVGALAWHYLLSTKAKTNLASMLNKVSWWTKVELKKWIWWEIEKLSEKAQKEVNDIVEKLALPALTEWAVNDAWYNILQSWEDIISTPEWTNIVKDSITEIK